MKKIIILLLNICLCIIVGTTSIYTWYTNYFGIKTDDTKLLSSNSSYYDSGTGTETDPYIISEARHLYNLAWLQDLGFYDDANTDTPEIDKFYFKLKNNIDMKDLTKNSVQSPIPPIGIDGHPFISNFNGTGFTIDNLIISTDFSNANYIKPDESILKDHTTDTISGGTIITTGVGTFGVVETKGTSTTGETTTSDSVSNFIINKAKINNTIESAVVGIVCGNAKGNLNQIGVGYSAISSSATLSSKYSLIGAVDASIKDDLSGAGGDLIIDPKDETTNLAESNTVVSVPGSSDAARYIGQFKITNYSMISSMYAPIESHELINSGIHIYNLSSADRHVDDYTNIASDYKKIYEEHTSGKVARFDTKDKIVTDANGKEYPDSGIWFDGITDGIATIFVEGNDSNGFEAFSVYQLEYNQDNKTLKNKIETTFIFENAGGRSACFFRFNVSYGKEYFLGSASKTSYTYTDTAGTSQTVTVSNRPKFVYFILPVGEEGKSKLGIRNIEFVDINNLVIPGLTEGYAAFKVYATLANSGEIWFVRKEEMLYYYSTNFIVSDTTATETTNKADVSIDKWGPPN